MLNTTPLDWAMQHAEQHVAALELAAEAVSARDLRTC